MRCKPGDLAVIIHCEFPQDIGKLVNVVQRIVNGHEWYSYAGEEWECKPLSPLHGWNSDDQSTFDIGTGVIAFHDAALKPIRDADGLDETLTWAHVPDKEFA